MLDDDTLSSHTLQQRFWKKVQKGDGCWLWTASRQPTGYGQFGIKNTTHFAHRIAYQLHYGPIPPNMCVLHRCDNRACVRPDHLFLGTTQDNTRDRVEKGRSATGNQHGYRRHPERVPRGDQHWTRRGVVPAEQIRENAARALRIRWAREGD